MKISEFFRKAQLIVLVSLGSYPLVAVAIFLYANNLLNYAWTFPAAFAVISVLILMLPKKLRVPMGICGMVLLILPCALLLNGRARSLCLPISMIYAAALFWSMFLPGWDADSELGFGWIFGLLAMSLVGCFFAWAEPEIARLASGIRLSFLAFVLLAMFSLNRGSLKLASGKNQSFPSNLRRKNFLLTTSVFILALAVSAVPWLYELLAKFLGWALQLFLMLQNLLTKPQETTEPETVPATTEDWKNAVLDGMEITQTSENTLAIMTALVLIVVLPAFIFIVYRLIKVAIQAFHGLMQLLEKASNLQPEDYTDEISDTRDEAQSTKAEKKPRRLSIRLLRNMTPTQKIRYRYKRLLSKHPEWQKQDTARNNLPEEAAKLYEKARYSEHTVTDADAEQFQAKTK